MMRGAVRLLREHPPIVARRRARPRPSAITDYLAGMTDRFALRAFEELSVPRGF